MGAITAHNNTKFVDSGFLLSRLRRELKTFDQMGILDPNDFYDYIIDVLSSLHLAGYIESSTILFLKDGKAKLPKNFKYVYSLNLLKCTTHPISHPRLQNGYVFYTDTLYERIGNDNPKLHCTPHPNGCKVTIREYIHGIENIDNYNYDFICRLRLAPSSESYCGDKSLLSTNHRDINTVSIENGYLKANFKEGEILLKYYALPIDEDSGLPLIPDNEIVQKAIRYYAMYQYFLNWYWNDEVPNGVAQKAAEAKKLYEESMGQAISESKLPHFATLVDYARLQRHRLDYHHQIDRFRNRII